MFTVDPNVSTYFTVRGLTGGNMIIFALVLGFKYVIGVVHAIYKKLFSFIGLDLNDQSELNIEFVVFLNSE